MIFLLLFRQILLPQIFGFFVKISEITAHEICRLSFTVNYWFPLNAVCIYSKFLCLLPNEGLSEHYTFSMDFLLSLKCLVLLIESSLKILIIHTVSVDECPTSKQIPWCIFTEYTRSLCSISDCWLSNFIGDLTYAQKGYNLWLVANHIEVAQLVLKIFRMAGYLPLL